MFDSLLAIAGSVLIVTMKLSVFGGFLAGIFLPVAFTAEKQDSFVSHAAAALATIGAFPLAAWAAIVFVLGYSVSASWVGWWIAGAFFGWLALIVGVRTFSPMVDRVKHKLTKRSDLERNRKTDAREIHKFLPKGAVQFNPTRFFDQKKGVFIGLDEDEKPLYVQMPGGTSAPHIQVVGTTGAGKGVCLGVMAAQFLARGEAVFFMDPKNDEWAPHVLYQECLRMGVPFHFVDLRPGVDAQLNPVLDANAEEIQELFIAAFALSERGDASDFYGIADRKAALLAAKYIAEHRCTMAAAFGALHGELAGMAEKFDGKLGELAALASINARQGGVDLAQVIDQGGCVYVVGSMRHDTIKTVQRMLLVRLIQIAETRDRMAGPLRPVAIVLDEVKYHISRPALEALGAARDKGVHLVLAHQSRGDLRDCPNDLDPDAVVDAIVENCRLKLAYRVINPDTAEWLSRMSGSILVDDEMRRIEKNMSLVETMNGERSIRQAERYLIDENMLLNLPKSVAVAFGDGLPKFVSIQPVKTVKSREAIAIQAVEGDKAMQAADLIDVGDADDLIPAAKGGGSIAPATIDIDDQAGGESIFDRLDSLVNPKPASPKAEASNWDDSPI
ncbi:MAG: hypothetical protein A3F73_09320 [Gallionellales bacterium RIFCSPLOWO2_12_FULL_59_22]|nr:MAG: hypothetical protein A3H99_13150 [Gallionellales bacterium RIFCSPLOWO2_02_FULL_59_110]OGT14610.1 MAG: hypothetical protein A3F73_09320 [Gallionellales bacterium RIFCSPLOWO2_12_FULL_59_22]